MDMSCRLRFQQWLLAVALLMSLPAMSFAQSSIAGVVRDTSNAVLPGVTVEAASPVLIERVRTAVTDGSGRYSIVDLRPGVYSVTFSLPGFGTVTNEGLVLPASFTATVNADLSLASVQETVTVTSESPVVDIQRTTSTSTFSADVMDAIPTSRMPTSYAVYVPAVITSIGTAAATGPAINALSVHGSNNFESLMQVDGFDIRNMNNSGGGAFYYYPNQGMSQEVTVTIGAAGADSQMASITTNQIPRDGGNRFSSSTSLTFNNNNMQGNNVTPELTAQGIGKSGIAKQWDYNPSGGGPLLRDRLWFYGAFRHWGTEQFATGSYYNVNPAAWVYVPDLSRPALGRVKNVSEAIRLTWQASPRNKFSGFFDHAPFSQPDRNFGATRSPESNTWSMTRPNTMTSFTWKSPVTNRLLLEAGMARLDGTLPMAREEDPELFTGPNLWDKTQVSARELTDGRVFRASDRYGIFSSSLNYRLRTAVSYVTGSHALKVGFDDNFGKRTQVDERNHGYNVSLRNGVPTSLTLFSPTDLRQDLDADIGLYVQDQWSIGRATLNLGLRYDYLHASRPGVTVRGNRDVSPGDAFQGVPDIVDPGGDVLRWHDLSPRMGASYDLFGTGKTALKMFLGRYVQGQSIQLTQASDPQSTSILSATRSWNDANRNFLPDCNFSVGGANGECGALSNQNFGLNNPNALTFDPAGLKGFGVRGYTWETNLSVQHEVMPGVSAEIGYYRKWSGNFYSEPGNLAFASAYQDNLLVTPADYSPYCLTVPKDGRLPGGGGNQLCGFYDINPNRFGQSRQLATYATNYGEFIQHFNGVDFNLNARLVGGGRFMGGASTGRSQVKQCFVIDNPGTYIVPTSVFTSYTEQFCDRKPPFTTQFKGTVIYPLPGGAQVTGVYLDTAGPDLSQTTAYVATVEEIQGSLGRPLSGGARTVSLPLMKDGTMYGDRIRRVDMRLSKVFRIGGLRVAPGLDIFNLLNTSTPVTYNTTYGPVWLNATTIMDPRIFRVSAQIDF